jgi:tRNA (adenine57-N1/adenine58-N1)-methyltransferase
MTLALAQAVMPSGQVVTYDNRPEMQALARKNLTRVGLDPYVDFKLRDVSDGFDETDIDALFFDLPAPWYFLDQAAAALGDGGFFGCILPTTNQVSELLYALAKTLFVMVEVEELILRPYKPVPARLRPHDRIIAHTGFLVFARKAAQDSGPAPAESDQIPHTPGAGLHP